MFPSGMTDGVRRLRIAVAAGSSCGTTAGIGVGAAVHPYSGLLVCIATGFLAAVWVLVHYVPIGLRSGSFETRRRG